MSNKLYKNILLAAELTSETDKQLIKKAEELSRQFGANLILVHAIEHISTYGAAYGVAVGGEIEAMLMENARKEMTKLGEKLNIPAKNQVVKFGSAKVIILDEAEHFQADLILVGSHGRHGIRLLLGSTANAVLHAASCDVLAVRIKD